MYNNTADQNAEEKQAEGKKIDFERRAGVCAQKTYALQLVLSTPVKKIRQVPEKTT